MARRGVPPPWRAPRRRRRRSPAHYPASTGPSRWRPCSDCSACSSRASPNAAVLANPLHLAWRQFLRGHGPSVLEIDATSTDVKALGSAAVLDRASWLLAEGVLVAAGLRDSRKVELRLPAELTGPRGRPC